MKRPTYVVIGSNSFSGGWMVDTLLARRPKSPIVGISRSPEKGEFFLPYKMRPSRNFHFYQLDILRQTKKIIALLDEIKPDYIINFAAQGEVTTSWEYPDQWYETNALAVVKLAQALKEKSYLKRYVHISTPEVYGSCKNAKEDHPLNPSTPYAASKASGDLFLFTLVKQYHFPLVMIRSTNVYGKHQQLYRIIPRTIIFLKMNKKIPLHGGGRAIKSYLHIQDVTNGIFEAMHEGKKGSIYHFSPKSSISVRNLVKRVCMSMGKDFSRVITEVKERPGQDSRYIINSSKARKELDWKPSVSLTKGLKEVIQWIEENYQKIKTYPLDYVHRP